MGSEDASSPSLHLRGLDVGHPEIDGNDAECHQSHIDIGDEHQHQGQDGTGEERQDFDEEVVDGVRETHDAAIDARLQLTRLVALAGKEGHAERQHAFDDFQ